MRLKLSKRKELFLCAYVALALICLIAILPAHAVVIHDWAIRQGSKNHCEVDVEVDGWYDTEDGKPGYFKTEHIAFRWVHSGYEGRYQLSDKMGGLIMTYETKWDNGHESSTGDSVSKVLTYTDPLTNYARTKAQGLFYDTVTGSYFWVFCDWATIMSLK